MNRIIALSLSIVFQPLVMPTLICAVLMYLVPEATSIPGAAKWSLLLLIFLSTFVVPLLSMLGLRLMNSSLDSLHMHHREQRVMPFSLVTVFYGITSCFFYFKINVDQIIGYTLALITCCLLILTTISFFWKISAHLMGASGLLAVITALMMRYGSSGLIYPFIGCVLLCGAVGSARLALDAHKPSEVYGGFFLGFLLCFSAYHYYYLLVS